MYLVKQGKDCIKNRINICLKKLSVVLSKTFIMNWNITLFAYICCFILAKWTSSLCSNWFHFPTPMEMIQLAHELVTHDEGKFLSLSLCWC